MSFLYLEKRALERVKNTTSKVAWVVGSPKPPPMFWKKLGQGTSSKSEGIVVIRIKKHEYL